LSCDGVLLIMAHFSNEEKSDMLCCYIESHKNCFDAERQYLLKYPERRQPNRSIFKRLLKNLREYGAFQQTVSHRVRTNNPEQTLNVLLAVQEDDTVGLRSIEKEHNVPKSNAQRILHKEGYRPFKFRICHSLVPGDQQRRMVFCEWLTRMCDENREFPRNILWSDESYFSNNGIFNRHNRHYWAKENEHRVRPIRHQQRFGFNVWCGILGTRIIGPIIYEGTLNAERYFQFLNNDIEDILDNIPLAENNGIWFMQDGAPPHNARINMEYLTERFQNKVIATNGPIRWPARSPDINPLDFFFWGYLNDEVYWKTFENVEQLRAEVQAAIARITPAMLENVMNEIVYRCYVCLENEGGLFEHTIK